MSYVLTYARVALATSDVQSILEIPANEMRFTWRIETMVLTKTDNDTFNRLARQQLHLDTSSSRKIISIRQLKRNMRISLDKRIAFSK